MIGDFMWDVIVVENVNVFIIVLFIGGLLCDEFNEVGLIVVFDLL